MSITVANARYNPDGDHFIVADAEVGDDLQVVCHVFLTCTHKIVGFTAALTLTYADKDGNKLGQSQQWTGHCSQAPIIGAAHASATITDKAPAGTVRVVVTETATVDNLFDTILGDVAEALKVVETVIEILSIFSGGALAGKGSNTQGEVAGVPELVV
ncbi:hypothetical protein [Actinomycetospora chiangmaiensis]|uniref:hypothetical protein n=1 Tax=Actinomycetospora chiangmaiensis TaxID=402650 RepID=UPI00036E4721|nr:hypothetical protein [Actinomycetospora chiangmaiensis]